MKRLAQCALTTAVATAVLVGCGGSQPTIGAPGAMSRESKVAAYGLRHGIPAPDSAMRGIYVSEHDNSGSGSTVYGYPKNNKGNGSPTCSESVTDGFGIAVDQKGNLIVTQQSGGVTVFKGPGMCGPKLGSFGLCCGGVAFNAASEDAANGMILVAALQNGTGYGSIQLCKLSTHSCTSLSNYEYLNFVYGVALAKNGDCWAAGNDPTALVYFKRCSGSGIEATGYLNSSSGSLDIDKSGNVAAIDGSSTVLYVYSGCNPACKVVGGPFPLRGVSGFGHLSGDSTTLAVADEEYGQVDIYKYNPTRLTYKYSFNNGLPPSFELVSAAYNPSSKQ